MREANSPLNSYMYQLVGNRHSGCLGLKTYIENQLEHVCVGKGRPTLDTCRRRYSYIKAKQSNVSKVMQRRALLSKAMHSNAKQMFETRYGLMLMYVMARGVATYVVQAVVVVVVSVAILIKVLLFVVFAVVEW